MINAATQSTSRNGNREAASAPPCFSLADLLPQLQPHPELDLKTLAYHLQQSDATAADGYHHAAVNEARSFVEALIISIVRVVQQERSAKQAGNGSPSGTAFRMYRRHLAEAGLISADENDLLQGIYSMASAKGSHQGVTDAAWTCLARQIVFATGQYVVRRYVDWKQAGRPIAPPPPAVVARGGFWRRWRRRIRRAALLPCDPAFQAVAGGGVAQLLGRVLHGEGGNFC